VLATSETGTGGESSLLGGDRAAVEALGARIGTTRVPPDPGGVIRRVATQAGGFDALSVVAAEHHLGRAIPRSPTPELIDYAGPAGTIETVRFADLLAGRAPTEVLRDRTVLVGPSAGAVGDLFPTPVSQNEFMPGAEIQANATLTAIEGFQLGEAGSVVVVVLILAAAAVPAVAGTLRDWWAGVALVAVAAAALLVGAQLAFLAGTIVPVTAPGLTLGVAAVGMVGARAAAGALERRHMREVFGRFVGDSVVEQALAQAGDDLRLGGREVDATVLFSDLRGFTGFSESLPPARVIEVLNRYLESMSDAILGHGGTLISYMGDGIMAVFGAPVAQPDHADRAVAAAEEMAGPRLDEFNAWLRETGVDHRFAVGIGVNSGPVLSGNVGSARRLEYTAIGDTTNTAARLEGMTKGTGHAVFVAESTYERLAAPDGLAPVGELPVRGRAAPVRVWTVQPPPMSASPPPSAASP